MAMIDAAHQVDVSLDGDVATLRLLGDLDQFARPTVTEVAHAALDCGATEVVLDGTGLSFADSSVVDLVIELRTRWPDHRIAVTGLAPGIARLFDLCQVPLA